MIRAWNRATSITTPLDLMACMELSGDLVWLDLESPTGEEERQLEALLGFELPTADEIRSIEPSSRLYVENGVAYLTANIVVGSETDAPSSQPVSFVLAGNRLITIRYATPRSFLAFARDCQTRPGELQTGAHILTGLVESIVDRSAEVLEKTGADVDEVGRVTFRAGGPGQKKPTTASLREALAKLARSQNLVSKTRDSLVSLGRMVGFAQSSTTLFAGDALREHMASISRDIQSLNDHASYLTSTIAFMLDAALGFINLQQNEIIKIFSVAAVMFLPPTLVASVYGMNFHHMPELDWRFGYPAALGLMIVSAIIPYWVFRKRGWV